MTERLTLSDVTAFLLRLSLSLETHGADDDELAAMQTAFENAGRAIEQLRQWGRQDSAA